MPNLEVIRKTVPAMNVAAIRLEIPTNDQVGELLPKAYQQLFGTLEAKRVAARGPALAFWHSTPDMFTDETVDVAVEIEGTSVADPAIQVHSVPRTEVASVVLTGPMSELQQCHVALAEWLAKENFRLEGAYREIYHTCGEDDATTEVQYPIVAEGYLKGKEEGGKLGSSLSPFPPPGCS